MTNYDMGKKLIEGWDDIYDDPYEAELARVAYVDDDPGGEMIADAAADQIIDDIQSLIKIDTEEYIAQGYSKEEAIKMAKQDAAKTLEMAMTIIQERNLKPKIAERRKLNDKSTV